MFSNRDEVERESSREVVELQGTFCEGQMEKGSWLVSMRPVFRRAEGLRTSLGIGVGSREDAQVRETM